MEQPGEPSESPSRNSGYRLLVVALAIVIVGVGFVVQVNARAWHLSAVDQLLIGAGLGGVLTIIVGLTSSPRRIAADDEAQARQRVRQAEDKLADSLRTWSSSAEVERLDYVLHKIAVNRANGVYADKDSSLYRVDVGTPDPEIVEQLAKDRAKERKDDRLTLVALWEVTHRRLDLYHQIVTRQAKSSFGSAQVAMGIGFAMLVAFAVLAAEAKTTTAAISAGGLGAVGAAFAAYIGKTFIRSQESAASHLRAYFDQPLELSRYLAAERLLADAKDLTAEQRAAILSSLVQAVATSGQESSKDSKPTGK